MRERATPCRGGRDEKGERSTGVVQASGVGGGGVRRLSESIVQLPAAALASPCESRPCH